MSIASRLRALEKKSKIHAPRCFLWIVCSNDTPDSELNGNIRARDLKQALAKRRRGDRAVILDPFGYADE